MTDVELSALYDRSWLVFDEAEKGFLRYIHARHRATDKPDAIEQIRRAEIWKGIQAKCESGRRGNGRVESY